MGNSIRPIHAVMPEPSAAVPMKAAPSKLSGQASALLLGYAVLYCFLDWVSFVQPINGTDITAWNPQWALAVALMMRYRPLYWPLSVSLVAAAVQPALRHAPPYELVASSVEVLGDVAIALSLRHWIGYAATLDTRREFLLFMLIVAVGSALQSGLYSTVLALFGSASSESIREAFVGGWVASANLIVALPLVLALVSAHKRRELTAMLGMTEWWLVAAAVVSVGYTIFARSGGNEFKHFYLLFLPAGWAAARYGVAGAVAASTLAQAVLVVAVQSKPYGPGIVFELHMLLVALGAMALLIGATVEEQRQSEKDLRASLHAAAAANMAAALAHELNQPLASLVNYAKASQILAERHIGTPSRDTEALVTVCRKLTGEALRASEVVRRLRKFFTHQATELQNTDLGMLVGDVVRSYTSKAAAVGATLEFEYQPAIPSISLDRVQIEVVLRNLVGNAIEAAALGTDAEALVKLAVEVKALNVVVSVIDSGPGIAPDEMTGVFEVRPSSKPGGMGIGLSISRSIVEAHNGRLWAEPGPGGRFFFSLPIMTGINAAL